MGPLLALALSASVQLPPWPLSPDGELVGVTGGAPLSAEGAEVQQVAPGLFRVRPSPGARVVKLAAGDAGAEAPVEPPPGAIQITADPPVPVKGRDASVALAFTVRDAAGAPDPTAAPPLVAASSGKVSALTPDGPGKFRARYEPSSARHPEVAVLFAFSPRCPLCATPRAVGDIILPLTAAIELPGESEPGIRTTVSVGGRTFGPVVADAQGRFKVPILVPPGAHAVADSVDETGNRKRTNVDLGLPEVDRLACAAWPRALPADGTSEAALWCAAAEAAGAPASHPQIVLEASTGSLTAPEEVRQGLLRARFRPPSGGAAAEARVVARYPAGGKASTEEVRIALGAGAPAEIAVALEREPLLPGTATAARIEVRDARGAPLGRPQVAEGSTEGFVAPDRFVARRDPGDWVQRSHLSFALPPSETLASLALRRRGDTWVAEARSHDARPVPGVEVRFGSGRTATTDARGEADEPATGISETVTGPDGVRAAAWEGLDPPAAPTSIARDVEVRLRPAAPVDVRARVDGRTLRWRVESGEGAALAGREVVLSARGVEVGAPERDGDEGRAALGPGQGTVAVVDVETGVAAVVEVR